jgi:uncharacterized repeat protein (TIGR01451 family)
LAAALLLGLSTFWPAAADPLTVADRARAARGEPLDVIVEFQPGTGNAAARAQVFSAVKRAYAAAVARADAAQVRDYARLPLSQWQLRSSAALERVERHPLVRRVHRDPRLRPNSVSGLAFIGQPAAVATGATGAGTTIAVIDGGLGDNYKVYADFGPCTSPGSPTATCRVPYNRVYYPGQSTETQHGTNVAAIALGVAPGARLANFDVFDGDVTYGSVVLDAMDRILSIRAQYNIVAVNLSLGTGSVNTTPCTGSLFTAAVAELSAAGVQAVASAGNQGAKNGLDDPACVPGVVSVGAVYNDSYGPRSWVAPRAPGGTCTDGTAPDIVACFSQGADYLTLLAPGSFIAAPDTSFTITGTSQAAPHASGVLALLRERYPAESMAQSLLRLKLGGRSVTDPANGIPTPRIDALDALTLGTALTLAGDGPENAVAGTNGTFSFQVANQGPLAATNGRLRFTLPTGATFQSASTGCELASDVVTCSFTSLAAGSTLQFSVNLNWTVSGPVTASAGIDADQANTSPLSVVSFATSTTDGGSGEGPLPLWTWVLAALGLGLLAQRGGLLRPHDRLSR